NQPADESMINRRRSGARGTPAKVNATAGLEASEGVNSASVSDGSHETVNGGPFTPQGSVNVGPAGNGLPFSVLNPYVGLYTIIALQGIFPSRN
ncbi:MAG: hypothetical protein ACRCSO_10780, partial [Sphingomonas sp.]